MDAITLHCPDCGSDDIRTSHEVLDRIWYRVAFYEDAAGNRCDLESEELDRENLDGEPADHWSCGDCGLEIFNADELLTDPDESC